jgi:hypothetical protein
MKPASAQLRLAGTAVLLCVPALLSAQEWYPKHNLSLLAGAALPRGEVNTWLSESPAIAVGYGYRFHRYFQADVGFDVGFGAADVRDFLPTGIGYLRIRDREYFVPMGGRVIAPIAGGRVLFSAGGGAAWMRYAEGLRQVSDYYRFDCPPCTSRTGWGYYILGNVSLFLNQGHNFRVGLTNKIYRGHTEGEAVGPVPSRRTKDDWLKLYGELGFSF